MILKFKILQNNAIPWNIIEGCYDQTVFKTREWFDFLVESRQIELFIVEISESDKLIGYFIGGKFSRLFSIVASPFEGWTTAYQGLSLLMQVSVGARLEIYESLIAYLFKNNICSFFQASDWQLNLEELSKSNMKFELIKGYNINLRQSEEQIYKKFSSSSCQYAIRKSQKNGVVIREATDHDQFVRHYYEQLTEVFLKQQLKPTYNSERVKLLIENLYDSGKLLLLEAISSEGVCMATGIFVGDNHLAYFWGGASYSKFQSLCPNEPIIYEAIKYWKRRGCTDFDLGGIRKYKEKYGPDYFEKPKIIMSKYPLLMTVRGMAKRSYYGFRHFYAQVRIFIKGEKTRV